MNRNARDRRIRLAITATGASALCAGVITAAAVGADSSPPAPPVHQEHAILYSDQLHAAGPAQISQDAASTTALGSCEGASGSCTVVRTSLTTVGAFALTEPSRQRPTSNDIGDDRAVWVVWVHGPFRPSFWAPGSQPPLLDHYRAVVDATSGVVLAVSSNPNESY